MAQTKQYAPRMQLGNVHAFKIKKNEKKNITIGREEKVKLRRQKWRKETEENENTKADAY